MRVVADRGILGLEDLERSGFDFSFHSGREIDASRVQTADALLVRSITRVDGQLLGGSRVGFVGTATSGCDHIDQNFLASASISLVDAKGANAQAVVDYVLAAIAQFALETRCEPREYAVGIIGAGCVGGLLDRTLRAGGFSTLCSDPPRAEAEGSDSFVSLEEAASCSIVCVHVPLSENGRHATKGLISSQLLRRMPRAALLINPSRGGVVDEAAVAAHLQNDPGFRYCADVWRDEPRVRAETLESAWLATPHIAGYSEQAKSAATRVLLRALVEFARERGEEHAARTLSSLLEQAPGRGESPGEEPDECSAAAIGGGDEVATRESAAVWQLIAQHFDLRAIDTRFRVAAASGLGVEEFDALRVPLKSRQELSCCRLRSSVGLSSHDLMLLRALGMRLPAPSASGEAAADTSR